MEEMLKKARLFVSTYNGTTWNESFIANVPTIMYWDPKYWERIQGTDYVSVDDIFDDLEKNKIYHKSSISAANFINTIWNNIDDWWYTSQVQSTIEVYCRQFAINKHKGVENFVKTIQKHL